MVNARDIETILSAITAALVTIIPAEVALLHRNEWGKKPLFDVTHQFA